MHRSQRYSLTPPRVVPQPGARTAAPDPHAPADLVVVSLAEAPAPDLQSWQRLLRAHKRTLATLQLGDGTDAFDTLCEQLGRCVGPLTRVVLVDPGQGEGIDGLAHLLDAWLREWRHDAGHDTPGLVSTLQTIGPHELDAGGLARVVSRAWSPSPAGTRASTPVPARVVGSLAHGVPVALLVTKVGGWSEGERLLLAQLQQALAPAPLLAIAVDQPARDLAPLEAPLLALVSPCTPALVLAHNASDPQARLLAAELGVLAANLNDGLAFVAGCLGRPALRTGGSAADAGPWASSLHSALSNWPKAIAWHDRRYLRRLDAWLHEALPGGRDNPLHRRLMDRMTRQLGAHLRGNGPSTPAAPLDMVLPMADLQQLPPLPPRRLASLTLDLQGCPAVTLALGRLPPDLQCLSACHGQLSYLTLDTQQLHPSIRIELDHNKLACIPLSFWALPATATVSLRGNPLAERTRRQIEATRPGAARECPLFETDPPSLREALRGWIDLPPAEARSAHWQRIEEGLGTPDFVAWVGRLARLTPRQRRTIRPQLVALIDRCAQDPALCGTVLANVDGADARCDDRVVLVWERVRLGLVCALACRDATAAGTLAAALLPHARRAFRTEKLLAIAGEKTRAVEAVCVARGARLEDVEEVEIHLAYLSQLDSLLDLGSGMGFALHIDEGISKVSLREVQQAAHCVKAAENAHFSGFLTQWEPWRLVLQHRRPEAFEAIREQRQDLDRIAAWTAEVQDGIDRMARQHPERQALTAREQQEALTRGLAECERRWVAEQLLALTHAVLKDEGAEQALDPFWSLV